MKSIKRIVIPLFLTASLLLSGCSTPPMAESWKLPKRENAESAMIIGRIDLPDNKKENPEEYDLYLDSVAFRSLEKAVYFNAGNMPGGEDNFVMYDNNYFVVPNIKPGKYYFVGFATGDTFNTLPKEDDDVIEIKPGQIRFIGSFDYLSQEQGFLSRLAKLSGSYRLRPAKHPTELEMLQWLKRVGTGSGWEPAIKRRIRELGGNP
jgi:hypothetical protein